MRCFVKSIRNEWDSKLDILSMAVSAEIGGEYWYPGSREPLIAQAADGCLDVPDGVSPFCVIYHDSKEYRDAKALVTISLGSRDGCRFGLASYPLRAEDMCRLPISVEFDAVIGGKIPDGAEESVIDALKRANLSGARVAIAVTGKMDGAQVMSSLLAAAGSARVEILEKPELPEITALYRTCPKVIHLGDCERGYLHSMAMFHAGIEGRTLVERVPGKHFEPSTMADLIQILKR